METARQLSPIYLLGYLRGRLKALGKGNLRFSHVEGALRLALRHGVPAADVAAVLREFGVTWDPSQGDSQSVAA